MLKSAQKHLEATITQQVNCNQQRKAINTKFCKASLTLKKLFFLSNG